MGSIAASSTDGAELSEDRLLARFDELVESGAVVYNRNYRSVRLVDQGFSFDFRILSSLATKPSAHSAGPPNCRPGSDIDVTGFEVCNLGPPGGAATHLLAANKFPAARPHFLILTQDGWRRQHEPLDADDFAAMRQVLEAVMRNPSPSSSARRYLAFFNCGFASGCSRVHKHMQIVPVQGGERGYGEENFPLWPDAEDPKPPFKFAMARFQAGLPPVRELVSVYRGLLKEAELAVGECEKRQEGEALPHNLILDDRWMVVVPRQAPGWEGADTNAMGMLGMVWLHSEERRQIWVEKGPTEVLKKLGYPA